MESDDPMITAMKTNNNLRIFQIAIILLLVAAIPAVSAPGAEKPDSLKTPEDFHYTKYRFWRAALEMEGFNIAMTMFGRFVMEPDGSGFVVSKETIKENLEAGMEWDDNTFSANNFRHPYQGALYFNAGRSNGYDFYQSSAFSFAGAWPGGKLKERTLCFPGLIY